jgi:hypothetical protein
MRLKLKASCVLAHCVIEPKCARCGNNANGLPPNRRFGGRPFAGDRLCHVWYNMLGVAAKATTGTGMLDVTADATGTATPATADPAKPSITRGEMMDRFMLMIPPWHMYCSAAFIWRQRPADASSVMLLFASIRLFHLLR